MTHSTKNVLSVLYLTSFGRLWNMSSKLHLVDDQGQPLPLHVAEAVDRLAPFVTQRFSPSCDPAELSNSIEHEAKKIAKSEKKKGPFAETNVLGGLTWRALLNSAITVVRKQRRKREVSLSAEALRNLTALVDDKSPETRLIRIQERQALFSALSIREQEYLGLREQGFDDEEIANHWKLSKNALAAFKYRLKLKLLGRGLLQS